MASHKALPNADSSSSYCSVLSATHLSTLICRASSFRWTKEANQGTTEIFQEEILAVWAVAKPFVFSEKWPPPIRTSYGPQIQHPTTLPLEGCPLSSISGPLLPFRVAFAGKRLHLLCYVYHLLPEGARRLAFGSYQLSIMLKCCYLTWTYCLSSSLSRHHIFLAFSLQPTFSAYFHRNSFLYSL
ncbi:hypothetical protein BC830DRAFT_62618 [Chytriomyces sp. MP71]|nr:hypothetical protein BC830DRAFT_62618 [Chytriomyces sp. MP71]